MTNRYSTRGAPEGEFQPGSRRRVLANKLGIVRVRQVQQAETNALLALSEQLVLELTDTHRFRATDLRAFHRRWLGSIYEWAGEYRAVNISKGGFPFAAASEVPRLMHAFERDVLAVQTPCRAMSEERLVAALARTHAEFVLIHPFREGNGRLARLLDTLMALQAGFPPLDYGGIRGSQRQRYIAAIQAALSRDYLPLETTFRNVLSRTVRGARA